MERIKYEDVKDILALVEGAYIVNSCLYGNGVIKIEPCSFGKGEIHVDPYLLERIAKEKGQAIAFKARDNITYPYSGSVEIGNMIYFALYKNKDVSKMLNERVVL
ncbi:MAG: hypothetical protein JJT76_13360 [Clostridiaceae bacterium]|nr:hypothetical protein [Clostridiaceae bacterium]